MATQTAERTEPTGPRAEERREEYLFAAPTADGRMRLAREHLGNSPRCWPYVWAAADAHMGLGPAASAYGMCPADFKLLVAAATEKVLAVAGKKGAT